MIVWPKLAAIVAEHGAAALVGIHAAKGSVPREAGARMVVRPDGAFHGSIGGGRLEWQALAEAREALQRHPDFPARFVDQVLGPDLGQCCGGRVTLLIETFGPADLDDIKALAEAETAGCVDVECRIEKGRVRRRRLARREDGGSASPAASGGWRETYGEALAPVLLFGAGHVGRALVLALAPLPFQVRWIDTREDAFPTSMPGHVTPVLNRDPVSEIASAQTETFVLVMTHEHSLDLVITAAALGRPFPYVGLIGSGTKRARFEKRFREIGLPPSRIQSLVCPIGMPGIVSKEPAVIAASTVAQLLQVRDKLAETVAPTGACLPA